MKIRTTLALLALAFYSDLPALADIHTEAGLPANIVVATIPVGKLPTGVVISRDSSTIYIANVSSSTISVINAATNTVVNTFFVAGNPFCLALSPDGSTLYVGCSNQSVAVVSTASDTVTATVNAGEFRSMGLALSPDGKQLYDLTGLAVFALSIRQRIL